MRELTVFEVEAVSGAGWLQDGLATMGGKLGGAVWSVGSDMLSIKLPVIGTINLTSIAPDMGTDLGKKVGSSLGGAIESALSSLPNIGSIFSRIFDF